MSTPADKPRWTVDWDSPAPGILRTRATGHLDVGAVRALADAFDAVAAKQSPVTSFHDWEAVSGYDTEAREAYVAWAKPHRGQVVLVHILVGNRMLALGISAGNLVLGGYMRAYHQRSSWQRLLDARVATGA